MSFLYSFLESTIHLSVPLIFAALGGYFSERAGTVNIALEGLMLIAAFASAAAASIFHSAAIGLLFGIAAAVLFSSLHGFLCLKLKTDQILSGLAVNLLAMGLSPFFSKALFDTSGATPSLSRSEKIAPFIFTSPLVLAAFFFCGFAYWAHHNTKLGQYIRFAGEHPAALESQGVSTNKVRWIGVLLCGFFCGLGGAYLSIDHGSGFSRSMTAGRGFIALAALILARWHPLWLLGTALLFGAIDSIQMLLQGVPILHGATLPVQWIQMIPYLTTLIVLSGLASRKNTKVFVPKALGTVSVLAVVFSTLLFSGCEYTDSAIALFNEKLAPQLGIRLEKNANGKLSAQKPGEAQTPADLHKQVNGEFLQELFQATLGREAREEEFVKLMNVLDQGAHYEGIYNGVVYSREYREKERGAADVGAVKAYAKIMTQIILDQKYDPLKIHNRAEAKPDVPPLEEAPIPQPSAQERAELEQLYEKEAIVLPSYTLKRRLGEEVLKTIDLKKEYREKLATWYGRFSFFLNKMGVDFGLAQRNSTDEYYHYKWALEADLDRLKWECLNRIHKILNMGTATN